MSNKECPMMKGARRVNGKPKGKSFSILAHLGIGYSLLDIGCSVCLKPGGYQQRSQKQ